MNTCDRRSVLTGLGAVGASLWLPPSADALGLADDKVKIVRYFSNAGDSQGRRGQPMVNQSTNVVMIETEGGLVGIGEGGEPTSMDECASMLIGQDPFRIDHHWQRMMRGYHYPAGREKLHSLGALDLALWDLKAKALDVPVWQLLGRQVARPHRALFDGVPAAPGRHDRRCGARLHRRRLPRLPACHGQPAAARSRPLRARAADARRQRAHAQGRR